MINLIPMGGKSSRFFDAGYQINKVNLPVTSFDNGKTYPMALASILSIPWIRQKKSKVICVNDREHQFNGLESAISKEINDVVFIHDHVKLDQAFGCFLAREFLLNNDELFIGASDNGFKLKVNEFNKTKVDADAIVLSHSGDLNIKNNPYAHSWLEVDKSSKKVKSLSFKQPLSEEFLQDHATTGMFWFKSSKQFLHYLEKMISIGFGKQEKFYIDDLVNFYLRDNCKVRFIDVKYLCWGTPKDYEDYQATIKYWKNFNKKFNN